MPADDSPSDPADDSTANPADDSAPSPADPARSTRRSLLQTLALATGAATLPTAAGATDAAADAADADVGASADAPTGVTTQDDVDAPVVIEQGGETYPLEPLSGAATAGETFQFHPDGTPAENPVADATGDALSSLFLWEHEGAISLVVLNDGLEEGTDGRVRLGLSGLSGDAEWAYRSFDPSLFPPMRKQTDFETPCNDADTDAIFSQEGGDAQDYRSMGWCMTVRANSENGSPMDAIPQEALPEGANPGGAGGLFGEGGAGGDGSGVPFGGGSGGLTGGDDGGLPVGSGDGSGLPGGNGLPGGTGDDGLPTGSGDGGLFGGGGGDSSGGGGVGGLFGSGDTDSSGGSGSGGGFPDVTDGGGADGSVGNGGDVGGSFGFGDGDSTAGSDAGAGGEDSAVPPELEGTASDRLISHSTRVTDYVTHALGIGSGSRTATLQSDAASWEWRGTTPAGGALESVGIGDEITIELERAEALVDGEATEPPGTVWQALSGDAEDPERVELDPEEPATLRINPAQVRIKHARVAQTVESTRVGDAPDLPDLGGVLGKELLQELGAGDVVPDPPLVYDRYATVLFDLDVPYPERLPEDGLDVTIRAYTDEDQLVDDPSGGDHSFTIDRAALDGSVTYADTRFETQLYDIDGELTTVGEGYSLKGDEVPPLLDLLAEQPDLYDGTYTTFVLVEGMTIELEIGGEGVENELWRTSTDELETAEMPELNVGLVGLEHEHPVSQDYTFDEDRDLEAFGEDVGRYVQRCFPTDRVNVFVHDETVTGNPSGPDVANNVLYTEAAEDAREYVEDGVEKAPANGTTFAISRGKRIDDVPMDAVDVAVGVVPQDGFFSGNRAGVYPTLAFVPVKYRSGVLTEIDRPATAAHEIGHYFLGKAPYPDELAQDDGSDNSHADEDLVSTRLHLEDGSFLERPLGAAVDQESEYGDTYYDARALDDDLPSIVGDRASLMSYDGGLKWPDGLMYRGLIESEFDEELVSPPDVIG